MKFSVQLSITEAEANMLRFSDLQTDAWTVGRTQLIIETVPLFKNIYDRYKKVTVISVGRYIYTFLHE